MKHTDEIGVIIQNNCAIMHEITNEAIAITSQQKKSKHDDDDDDDKNDNNDK